MITYPIGAVAETVLAVRIDLAGRVTPIVRRQDENGELVTSDLPTPGAIQITDSFDLMVRVFAEHSGTLEILPGSHKSSSSHTIIPLGPDSPVLESELPPTPGAAGAGWKGTFVEFKFNERRLSWQASNIACHVNLSDEVPLITIALRLPPENGGEIILAPHLTLTTKDSRSPGRVDSCTVIRAKT